MRDAYEALADELKLTAQDRAEMLPSGAQAVYKNRIGWAHDRLKRANLSVSPKHGIWQLTAEGRAFAEKNKALSPADRDRIASQGRGTRLKIRSGESPDPAQHADNGLPPSGVSRSSPEERIESALAELRESVARDLLEIIGRSPPAFFEQLVLDLLHAMGYGATRSDLQRVG